MPARAGDEFKGVALPCLEPLAPGVGNHRTVVGAELEARKIAGDAVAPREPTEAFAQ